jgi:hypothetical protein
MCLWQHTRSCRPVRRADATCRCACVAPDMRLTAVPLQCTPTPRDFSGPTRADGSCAVARTNLRAIFQAPAGWSLLSADYRQMELRILAHLSGDEKLLHACSGEGASAPTDPFTVLAAEMFGDGTLGGGTDTRRAAVKQLFYALTYGMGRERLSKELHCDANTAGKWRDTLFGKFPRVWSGPSPHVDCMCVLVACAPALPAHSLRMRAPWVHWQCVHMPRRSACCVHDGHAKAQCVLRA